MMVADNVVSFPDRRDDIPDYVTGPRRTSTHTPGPVIEAYVDTDALEFDCGNCQAAAGDFCKQPDGSLRKMPCTSRIQKAARAAAALTEGVSTDGR